MLSKETIKKLKVLFKKEKRQRQLVMDIPAGEIPPTPLEFIFSFYLIFSKKYLTSKIYGGNKVFHCSIGKNRSIYETYDILLNYFPKCTVEEYLQYFFEFVKNLNSDFNKSTDRNQFFAVFCDCPNIKKFVLLIRSKEDILRCLNNYRTMCKSQNFDTNKIIWFTTQSIYQKPEYVDILEQDKGAVDIKIKTKIKEVEKIS